MVFTDGTQSPVFGDTCQSDKFLKTIKINPERKIRKVTLFYWWDVDRLEDEEQEFHSTTEIAAFAFLDRYGNQVGGWKSTSSALDQRK